MEVFEVSAATRSTFIDIEATRNDRSAAMFEAFICLILTAVLAADRNNTYGFANLFLRIFVVNCAIGGRGCTPVLARDFVRSSKTVLPQGLTSTHTSPSAVILDGAIRICP